MNYYNLWVNFEASYNGVDMLEVLKKGKKGRVKHNMRLYEIEAAKDYGIAFDGHWYSIDTRTRSMMIAGTLVRNMLNNLEAKQARSKAYGI